MTERTDDPPLTPPADPVQFPAPTHDAEAEREPVGTPGWIAPDHAGDEVAFSIDGESWIARIQGAGAAGTGALGLAPIASLRFYRTERPDKVEREALVGFGALQTVFVEELIRIWRTARQYDEEGK